MGGKKNSHIIWRKNKNPQKQRNSGWYLPSWGESRESIMGSIFLNKHRRVLCRVRGSVCCYIKSTSGGDARVCGTVCRLTFKGTDVERASLKLAARRTSEMSLEGFICFHPQMLCNKGFKDVLWTGWSLDAVLFIYYFKLDLVWLKKGWKSVFCARIMFVALSPSKNIVNLVKFHPPTKKTQNEITRSRRRRRRRWWI